MSLDLSVREKLESKCMLSSKLSPSPSPSISFSPVNVFAYRQNSADPQLCKVRCLEAANCTHRPKFLQWRIAKFLAFHPFSQTGLHGRQGLDWDSCICLPATDSLSWGKDTHSLLLSGFLSAGSCLPRHWVEETSGQRDWGQGWVGGWNNIYHLSRSLISRQIVFELLGAVWVITEMQQFPELKDPQQNSMQKPRSAIIEIIVVSKYYFSMDLK